MKYDRSVTIATPASEPLTLDEAKNQCQIPLGDSSRDDELRQRIVDAREVVEGDTQRILISRTVTEKFTTWPDELLLLWSPVSSITSVTYYDSTNSQQTVSSGDYSLDAFNKRIVFDWDYVTPVLYDRWDAITVTYVAGYGTTPASIPGVLKQMMRLQLAYAFDSRNMLNNEMITGRQLAYQALLNRVIRAGYP